MYRSKVLSLFLVALVLLVASCSGKIEKKPGNALIGYVDPFIGTGFHGHTFPGPVMPHGMVQPGPDTRLNGWDASSGYHYSDSTIYGFSQTHLSGTGIGDMGDLLLLPFTGEEDDKPIALFDKKDEHAEVGYYKVRFKNFDVEAELTAGMRVAYHRYMFSGKETKRVLLDVGHILQRTWGHSNMANEFEIIDRQTIRGLKYSKGWAQDHRVYFYLRFSSPFILNEVNINGDDVDASAESYQGKNVHAYLQFEELKTDEALEIKIGISAVDMEGAENNLKSEMPNWDFKALKERNQKAWEKELERIKVFTGDKDKKTTFYTALYHSLIAPMIYQDADGRYRGMDLQIHQAKEGHTNNTVYSLWDTFRALHPLMTIINEKKSVDWVNNLLVKYQEGDFLPKWPLCANYTGTMVAYPAVANIADALSKELPGINKQLALEASVNSARYKPELIANVTHIGKRELMPLYNKFVDAGTYIPADSIAKSVSYGLEMAYYDWCIAQIAKLTGDEELYHEFDKRGQYYRFYFDKETGFMRGKNADGTWVTPFHPRYSSHDESEYVEGNAWQWTWFVPHDLNGFVDLFPDKAHFIQKLDSLFTTSSEVLGEDASDDITGLIGQYAHGNEPSHHIAYFYTYLGQAWKTQELVDKILHEFYPPTPEGIIGNEDCGQMSAWYILNAMGFYQLTPGDPTYVISRPLFNKVEIALENDKVFTIQVENNSKANKYVQHASLNGTPLPELLFGHKDIKKGGLLKIIMGDKPKFNN
ncbi:alpha-1,2-mannosidase, putative [Saccharicrinis carchari]|uniref:Alpha-1,2-mannosidase, putative n=1 Tax=Saccharicrinis carchari TaxID=1168039 RepID=A0A521D1X4_SACCC|nr:GH92 family glycosyl hydrolase [Saccharicrinis carchari]SMO65678.1 alpha-1,2-mannosidase, putative [Saccharicrinis carchari]